MESCTWEPSLRPKGTGILCQVIQEPTMRPLVTEKLNPVTHKYQVTEAPGNWHPTICPQETPSMTSTGTGSLNLVTHDHPRIHSEAYGHWEAVTSDSSPHRNVSWGSWALGPPTPGNYLSGLWKPGIHPKQHTTILKPSLKPAGIWNLHPVIDLHIRTIQDAYRDWESLPSKMKLCGNTWCTPGGTGYPSSAAHSHLGSIGQAWRDRKFISSDLLTLGNHLWSSWGPGVHIQRLTAIINTQWGLLPDRLPTQKKTRTWHCI